MAKFNIVVKGECIGKRSKVVVEADDFTFEHVGHVVFLRGADKTKVLSLASYDVKEVRRMED